MFQNQLLFKIRNFSPSSFKKKKTQVFCFPTHVLTCQISCQAEVEAESLIIVLLIFYLELYLFTLCFVESVILARGIHLLAGLETSLLMSNLPLQTPTLTMSSPLLHICCAALSPSVSILNSSSTKKEKEKKKTLSKISVLIVTLYFASMLSRSMEHKQYCMQ